MAGGNQLAFFNDVKLTDDGHLIVDLDGLQDLIQLLSVITIQIGNIGENQQTLIENIEQINCRIGELTSSCEEINTTVALPCPTTPPPCPSPTLIDDVYVHPSGQITNSVPKGTVYNWGGWNIVG
jgi:hypothetical protein